MTHPDLPSRDAGETLAIQALVWLAAQDDLMPQFLAMTGAAGDDLRRAAQDPNFLGAVLDFILAEDDRVIAFCDAHSIPYTQPGRARAVLPGGDLPHWT
ncbi:DUF3572 domain-containing protein [Falsirhodobacter halotolerans]|uniref:DUF3572 domain-containing protein n=1 Tax=Falsirhodobacter halotolerans TaxID=1146892 RepID=UPI001FD3D4F5|nr:DUF3572 domain-containing protein [Falsirhodobacter halotolerans]MCJ8140465.1 DUF3572 domain-containing protein [Falsirhodobacter halotolerans]